MRILYHSRTFATGGARIHIDQITGQLSRQGHEVKLVEPVSGGRSSRAATGLSWLKEQLPRAVSEILEYYYSYKAFADLSRHTGYDVLYERAALFNMAGSWYAAKHGIPFILEVNSPLAYEREQYAKLIFKRRAYRLEREVMTAADRIVCVSHHLKELLVQIGAQADKVHVMHNGIDSQVRMRRGKELKDELELNDKVVIGFVGYMLPWHGGDAILRVLGRLLNEHDDLAYLLVGGIDHQLDTSPLAGREDRMKVIEGVGHPEVYEYIDLFDIGITGEL